MNLLDPGFPNDFGHIVIPDTASSHDGDPIPGAVNEVTERIIPGSMAPPEVRI